jgi:hypothetical protein
MQPSLASNLLVYCYRKLPLDLETLLDFLLGKFPSAHFFIDEIPVDGKGNQVFKGLSIKGMSINFPRAWNLEGNEKLPFRIPRK